MFSVEETVDFSEIYSKSICLLKRRWIRLYNYNVNIKPYIPPATLRKKSAVKGDEEQTQSSSDVLTQQDVERYEKQENDGSKNNNTAYAKGAIDYNAPKIGISQILVDFRGTMKAIGVPAETEEEVSGYLDLVQVQASKDVPSSKIIKANLKNASQIIDDYIAKTLKKPSKVVENWVDALFLQQVNYKADKTLEPEQEIPSQTEVIPIANAETASESTEIAKNIYLPENKQLRSLYIKAKKYSNIDQTEKALDSYDNALALAQEIDDKEAQSAIYLSKGKIFDKANMLPEALENYNSAAIMAKKSGNYRIGAKAHYEMGSIYDDLAKFDPAMSHYFAALSYDGENENLSRQTKTLNNIGVMYTDRYDKSGAVTFYSSALDLAKESKDAKAMGDILGNTANLYEKFEDTDKAIKYYGQAIKCNENAKDYKESAINYKKAAQLMEESGYSQKARTLYQKAYDKAVKSQDLEIAAEIDKHLLSL